VFAEVGPQGDVGNVQPADSWATDGHKWLNVPYDCGYAFIGRGDSHRGAMSHRAPYLVHNEEARDQIDWNPEWSRRARGFPTYAALRQLGRSGVAEMIERCCASADQIVTGIGALAGTQVLWQPRLNQGLVRFRSPLAEATEQDHDRHTDEVISRINGQRGAFFGGTTRRGKRAMRVSVCNWQTSESHAKRAVASVAEVLQVLS
jgi:glutamate/tyrosine decarboxylase-like PLP-dependent enzyme